MREAFHEQLRKLQEEILRMGVQVEQAIEEAVKALKTQDVALAKRVIEGDHVIDRREIEIERECLRLLALQQPMAADLRVVSTGLKIITDLERMADHATDIAKTTVRMADTPLIKPLIDIPRMALLAQGMVRGALAAYVAKDEAGARTMIATDDELDHLYAQIFRELLVIMLQEPRSIEQATQLLFVASHLERIGDHATNIGEWVIYTVTGERPELND